MGTFGSCGAVAGYLGDSAGALRVSGGYLGSFWEAVRKLTRTWRDFWKKLWRALGWAFGLLEGLAGWAMGGSYMVAAPVEPAGEHLQATSFTWTEFGCLC